MASNSLSTPGASFQRFSVSPMSLLKLYNCPFGSPGFGLVRGTFVNPPELRVSMYFHPPRRAPSILRELKVTISKRPSSRRPVSTGNKFSLSSPSSSASLRPAIAAKVASKSVWHTNALLTEPAFTTFGQRTMNGMRWPASQESPFMPRNGVVALWPNRWVSESYHTGPLSLVNNTSVSRAKSFLSSAFRIWPTVSSTIATKSVYILLVRF